MVRDYGMWHGNCIMPHIRIQWIDQISIFFPISRDTERTVMVDIFFRHFSGPLEIVVSNVVTFCYNGYNGDSFSPSSHIFFFFLFPIFYRFSAVQSKYPPLLRAVRLKFYFNLLCLIRLSYANNVWVGLYRKSIYRVYTAWSVEKINQKCCRRKI